MALGHLERAPNDRRNAKAAKRFLAKALIGAGTPKEAAARGQLLLLVVQRDAAGAIIILASPGANLGVLVVIVSTDPA